VVLCRGQNLKYPVVLKSGEENKKKNLKKNRSFDKIDLIIFFVYLTKKKVTVDNEIVLNY